MWERNHLLYLMILTTVITCTKASFGRMYWNKFDRASGELPEDAIIGGHENDQLYIIRAPHEGSVAPGKFFSSTRKAFIPWGFKSHPKTELEILCGNPGSYKWVQTRGNNIPLKAVVGGRSEADQEKLYVCRFRYGGHLIPGKMQPSHHVCYIAYGNKEISSKTFEILVGDIDGTKVSGKPSKPSKIFAGTGKTIEIKCETTKSKVPPTISWEFKAKGSSTFVSIPESGTVLHISDVDDKDAGVYKCIATNSLGSAVYLTDLAVQSAPELSGKSSDTVAVGKTINIECKVKKGNPLPTISWEFKAKDSSKFESISGSGAVLRVTDVDVKDAGVYKCIATNALGSAVLLTELTVQSPPKVLGKPSGTAVFTAGNTVDIECKVTKSNPPPTITWQFKAKGSSTFESISGSGTVLRIPGVDDKDAGVYKCIATNALGSAVHLTDVTVQSVPTLSGKPSDTVAMGKTINIECKVIKSNPQPTIRWQFKAKGSSKFESISGSGTVLRISNVDDKDTGVYKCIATNSLGSAVHLTELTVQSAPELSGKPSDTVAVGKTLNIECKITKSNPLPTITWQFKAKGSSTFESISGSGTVLRVTNADDKDAGVYKCIATNALGSAVHLTDVTVQSPPVLLGNPSETAAVAVSNTIDIECKVAKSNPPPTITWQFKAKGSSTFESISGSNTVLRVTGVDDKDAGVYKCTATNALGSAVHLTELTVQSVPTLSGKPSDTVAVGKPIDIECKVIKSNPQPTISWQFKAKGSSNFESISGSNTVLRISGVDEKDAGVYKCIATNALGSAVHLTELIVQSAPELSGKPSDTVAVGKTINIECKVTRSNPPPTITWQFKAKGSSKFESISGSGTVLRVTDVDDKDAGVYKCIATNALGSASHLTELTVQSAPKVLGNPSDTAAIAVGNMIDIECKVIKSNPPPTISWQFKPRGSSKFESISGSGTVLHLSGVDDKDAGVYKCTATNALGSAVHLTELAVQSAPELSGKSRDTIAVGKTVNIECKVIKGNPPPTVSWQFKSKDGSKFEPIAGSNTVLRLSDVGDKNAGVYKCIATNSLGSAVHLTELAVLSVPHPVGKPNDTVAVGKTINIECKVTESNPPPTISWEFKPKGSSKFESIPGSGTVLRVTDVDDKDAGVYKCIATNALGSAVHLTELTVQRAPVLSGKSKDTVAVGKTINIECKVIKSNPPPTISWQFKSKDGSKFESIPGSNTVLRVTDVGDKDAGVYKCIATNSLGSAVHLTELAVLSVPHPVGKPNDTVAVGKTINIECKVTESNPPPTISWEFKPKGSSKFESIPGSGTVLRVTDVDDKDAGVYKCIATNALGSAVHLTELTVEWAPVLSGKASDTVAVGKTINIECKVTKGNPPPTISWQFKSKDGSKFESIPGSNTVLRITDVGDKDAGVYKCIATNSLGSAVHLTELAVLSVPNPVGKPSDSVAVGKTINIECKVTKSNPPPTISWEFKPKGSSKFESIPGSGTVLRVTDVDDKDAGVYKCIATNALGSAVHLTELTVQTPPKVLGKPSASVAMGKTIVIVCKVIKGNPPPTITWQFKPKGSSKFESIPGSNTVLRITEVDDKDSGVYKCIATNALGSADHLTEVTVLFGSRITTSSLTKFNSVIGDLNLTIPCNVDGAPKPKITWKVNGLVIKQDTHYSITSDGALVIRYPEESDSNSYTCVAENNLGHAEATFTVKVHPFDYGTIHETSLKEGTTKMLDCGPVGPTQSVKWYVEGLETNIEERYYRLENAEDGVVDGNYTCRVVNKDGTYKAITYQVSVAILQFSTDQEEPIIDWNGSELEELDCDVDASPTPDIKWRFYSKELKNEKSTRLAIRKLGVYTCTVTNIHGSIQRSFNVTSSNCLVPRNPIYMSTMPLLLTPKLTWPALDSGTDYVVVEHGQTVTFACPIHKEKTISLAEFPRRNEITARCDHQDIFRVGDVSYKTSSFRCTTEVESEILRHKQKKCLTKTSELIGVGFDVGLNMLESYEVCFDVSKNIALYSRAVMSMSNRGRSHAYSWYKHTALDFPSANKAYTCTNSISSCCYTKAQLVNARDVGDGPPQKSTFIDPLNVVPLWLPCGAPHGQSPWASIEDTVRSRLDSYDQFVVWSGTHKLQNIKGNTIPRYLWKVVRFAADDTLAMIYVNGPSPTAADILCKNICADNKIIPWIHEHDGHTYCCQVDDFIRAFGLSATTVGGPL